MRPFISYLSMTLLLCLLTSFALSAKAKNQGEHHEIYSLTNGQPYTELPFRLINNLIVIPVVINGEKELNFILDTGTSSPILLNNKYVKDVSLPLGREVSFQGSGSGQRVNGHVISTMSLQIGDALAKHIGGIVLDHSRSPLSNLRLEGHRIHGILGATLFRSFAVEIDYITQTLRLHKGQRFLDEHSYSAHTIHVEVSRPILKSWVRLDERDYCLNLMIDTGFSDELLIYDPSVVNHIHGKLKHIGTGYSGHVKGSATKINSIKLANRQLFNVNTYFPTKQSYKRAMENSNSSRDGIMGNALLKQFCVVLDYAHEKFYIQEHLLHKPALAKDHDSKKVAF